MIVINKLYFWKFQHSIRIIYITLLKNLILIFMKKALIIIFVVLSCIQANAQTLTGVVYDKATKQSIPGAYVYLDGTSIVDVTTNSGKFTLSTKQLINTKLVLSHVGYHPLIIENPFMNLPDTIYMEERSNILGEVTVQADRFSRRQKLRAFREQFLGMTQAGRSCRIVNEDDIQIWFNVATKTLFASSEQPIEVINEYLGYRIFFTLLDFKAEYSTVTLNPNRSLYGFYAVTTSFTNLNTDDNRRIKRHRDDIHEISSRNFFKNLANNSLLSADTLQPPTFNVYKNRTPIDLSSYFIIEDTLSLKMLQIPDSIIENKNLVDPLLRITVSQRNNENSEYPNLLYYSSISFFTDTLLVDQYGNIDQFDKVFFGGQMGLSRAGDMLPLEYEP